MDIEPFRPAALRLRAQYVFDLVLCGDDPTLTAYGLALANYGPASAHWTTAKIKGHRLDIAAAFAFYYCYDGGAWVTRCTNCTYAPSAHVHDKCIYQPTNACYGDLR